MEAATAVESAATEAMGPAIAMESASSVEGVAAMESAISAESTVKVTAAVETSSTESSAAVVTPAPAASVPTMVPAPPVPRTNAQENAVVEPLRAVVSVGCARIRRIRVIAVGADRRWADISRTNSDGHWTHCHANANLRLRRRRGNHQENSKHRR